MEASNKNKSISYLETDWGATVVIGVILFVVMYMIYGTFNHPGDKKLNKKTPARVNPSVVITSPALSQASSETHDLTPTLHKPSTPVKFDFYSMLKNNGQPAAAISSTTTLGSKQFQLQIATLKNKNNAVQLQHHLLALGYSASIKNTRIKNKNGFKVMIGPYTAQSQAKADQKVLLQQKINSLLLPLQS